jgi:hypothetical protein
MRAVIPREKGTAATCSTLYKYPTMLLPPAFKVGRPSKFGSALEVSEHDQL